MSNKDYQIDFNEEKHEYTRNGIVYTSCTTVIEKYKPKFDKRYWSMYSTLKEDFNMPVRPQAEDQVIVVQGTPYTLRELYAVEAYAQGVLKRIGMWDEITERACARGNEIHDWLEDSINESKDDKKGETNDLVNPLSSDPNVAEFKCKSDLDKTEIGDRFPEVYDVLLKYINQGCTIFAEKKIFIDRYLVSGMIDCLIVKGRQFMIVDWKTNKDIIHQKAGYYKKVNLNGVWSKSTKYTRFPKFMLDPIQHLEECKGVIYSLQLSLYAYMMEAWGYTLIPNGMMLFHFRPECKPERIPIGYYKQEIYAILEHHNKH